MSSEGRPGLESVPTAPAAKPARPTAVLIDDMSEIRMLLRMALEDVGIEVVGEAADGAAGVEVAGACLPDIVILDVSMPVMDGLTALPGIREQLPNAKIIMLSAFDRELCEEPALSRGADAYVEKGQVDQLIRTVLELSGLRAEPRAGEARERAVPSPRHDPPALRVVPPPEDETAETAPPAQAIIDDLRAQISAAQANLDQLAYMVSHDLAEPINLIVGFAERLADRWKGGDPTDAEFLGYVTAAAHRAQAMLDDVYAYAQSGTQELSVEYVDCQQVVEDVCASLAGQLRATGARLRHDRMPRGLHVNRLVLTSVLQNLVKNAITFVAPGITPQVELSATRQAGFWEFRVQDNGIGIAGEDAERIFLPFKRLHAADYAGNGIGLAICRQLVVRHGGRIELRSSDGRGTVMAFTLPDVEPRG